MKNGWKVDFISSSKKSKETSELKRLIGVTSLTADPNDIKSTSQILNKLKNKPDIAIFDTFSVEEKFRFFTNPIFKKINNFLKFQ